MPRISQIKRKTLIKNFRKLGFDGPFSGGNHQYMQKDILKVRIPNPHQVDISQILLTKILKQANIDKNIWEAL